MKADYKNWMPQGMINGFASAAVVCWVVFWIINNFSLITAQTVRSVVSVVLLILWVLLIFMTVWMILMHRAFSYKGNRQMSKQIIEGVAEYVNIPDGGKGLDVGCGSGALTIACAKRNPNASFMGIDRWGKEYASFNRNLCENNAQAEGVSNVSFRQGDATKLPFDDETFDVVTSNYVYHNIPSKDRQAILLETLRTLKKGGTFAIHDIMSKGKYGDMKAFEKKLKDMGYEDVQLIDTTDGKFMSKWESTWMGLSGSTLLVGTK
ncbi:class I SAM-dependent methyltransferase [Butyrivibrio fibrisolvens]|uniref:class I SAM-dependent methyltransferase n=1 Tax=Pseudobutyrivibrio ruminis TaxID=46206 RepID=UPI0003FE0A45|nr:class I SAM-dependent methyltransferase [Pseudobutyrivibrio ruminis]MDC7279498.1 class I SAM-dependent methyltransferase [Butyrivibrio fibrisolvens]